MKKTNNCTTGKITDYETLRNQVFLTAEEVGAMLRIGGNSTYDLLGSDRCPFPVYRLSRQIIRIPAKAFWDWYDSL